MQSIKIRTAKRKRDYSISLIPVMETADIDDILKIHIKNVEIKESLAGSLRGSDPQLHLCTPKNDNLFRSSLLDSGYSSLPQSPNKFTENKLRRRSLSLQDTDTPFTQKSVSKRAIFFDALDSLIPVSPSYKRQNSSSVLTNADNVYKQTVNTLDILDELALPFPHIVSKILSYLNGKSLTAVSCVNHSWNLICRNDRNANTKKLLFLKKFQLNKENRRRRSTPVKLRRVIQTTPLNDRIQTPPLLVVEPEPTQFERFVEAGKDLPKGCVLVKCMRCNSPSRRLTSSPMASCTSPSCLFKFCSRCECQYTDGHICVQLSSSSGGSGGSSHSTPTTRMGTSYSKQNLRRL